MTNLTYNTIVSILALFLLSSILGLTFFWYGPAWGFAAVLLALFHVVRVWIVLISAIILEMVCAILYINTHECTPFAFSSTN